MHIGLICSILLGLVVFVSSLQTPSSFSARFTAIPRQNPAIKYQGIVNANKNETWSIEAITRDEHADTTYIHSEKHTILVRGNPTATCTKQLVNGPPIVQHLERIFDAQPVKTDVVYDAQVQNCLDEKLSLHAFEFEGETFVFCAKNMAAFEIKRVVGRDIIIEIEDFQFGENPVVTKVAQTFDRCREIQSTVTSRQSITTNRVPWFLIEKESCGFSWTKHAQNCPSSNAQKRECVFLHGAGESIIGPPQNASHDYWGEVHTYVPQCETVIFSFEDTKNNGWDNKQLQHRYCDIALSNQKPGERTIRNKIIFTHSMANLLLSAGIHNGYCDMDLETTSWYSVDPPFHGSKAANLVTEVCKITDPTTTDALYQWVSHALGYCIPNEHRAYPGTATNQVEYCSPDGTCMKDLRAVAEKRVKGIQCGESPFGLSTLKYSTALEALSMLVQYGEPSDGLVPYSSCSFKDQDKFVPDFTQPMYRSQTNHADGTCRNADGYWGADRKPCSWYGNKE